MFYVSCHCNGRLDDDVEFLYKNQEAEAVAIGQCVEMLFTEPKPQEAMPDAHQDMCKGKGSGKGKPRRAPQMVRKMDPSGSKMAGSLATSSRLETCPVTPTK